LAGHGNNTLYSHTNYYSVAELETVI